MTNLNRRELLGALSATAGGLTAAAMASQGAARVYADEKQHQDTTVENGNVSAGSVECRLRAWPDDGDWKQLWNQPLRFPKGVGVEW